MKKIKAISVAAVLFSGLTLGTTITTPMLTMTQAHAADTKTYTNKVQFREIAGGSVIASTEVSGKPGEQAAVTAPNGYTISNPAQSYVVIQANNYDSLNAQTVLITKKPIGSNVNMKITFVDSATNKAVGSQLVSGNAGDTVPVDVPGIYSLNNSSDAGLVLDPNVTARTIFVSMSPLAQGQVINNVKYRDVSNKDQQYVYETQVKGTPDSNVSFDAPLGYKLAYNQSPMFLIGHDGATQVADVIKDVNAVFVTLNFVDKTTGEIVGNSVVSGDLGQTISVNVPSSYTAVNSTDNSLVITKGQTVKNILVTTDGSNVQSSGNEVDTDQTIMIKSDNVTLMNSDLSRSADRGPHSLGKFSDWRTDKMLHKDGQTYYRVSTNEWVNSKDVLVYTAMKNTVNTTDSNAALFSAEGVQSKRSLNANSAWATDRSANINGETMYRVSTNEWVQATNIK